MDAYAAGDRVVLLVAPTASGKTSTFGSLAAQVVASGKRVLVVVHRRELAEQAAKRFREFGVDFGFVMAGMPRKPYARLQIASVQTLVRRRTFPPADLVIFDEAHLSTARTWQEVRDAYPRARILGATATPWRLGGKPLSGAYDACVVVATPADLRRQGYLSPYVGFSYLTPDLSKVKTTGGDYNEQQSAEAMRTPQIVDSIVEQWQKYASTLSTVVFAVTVAHSCELTDRFKAAGIAAEHLDGGTSTDQRKAILGRMESGATRVLCNVGVAVEGLDIPRLKCCVLARPTKSLARYIQMVGRVRRPWEGQTARIHDHAFNLKLHGLPDADRDYSLSAKPEDPPSLTQCSECLALYDAGKSCPNCGRSEPEPAGERVLSTVSDAEMFEFGSDSEPAAERNERPVEVRWDTVGRVIKGVFQKRWDEDTAWGKQRRYLLRGEKRDYSVPGTTRLNALMAKVAQGEHVTIEQLESTALGGGKERKEFRVVADDGKPDPRAEAVRLYQEGKTRQQVDRS